MPSTRNTSARPRPPRPTRAGSTPRSGSASKTFDQAPLRHWSGAFPFMLRAIRWGIASLGLGILALSGAAAELQRFELVSEYLKAPVTVEVLVPDGVDATARLPVVYVLAAEPRTDGNRGLAEIQRLCLADKHRVICVGVNFDTMPWYGDHATDPGIG